MEIIADFKHENRPLRKSAVAIQSRELRVLGYKADLLPNRPCDEDLTRRTTNNVVYITESN